MNLGTAQVIRADARSLPIEDNSVDLCISSPPYWSLRSYQDNGSHYDGQIGSEPTSAEFLANLLDVMRECVRVTKPAGSIFWNLGDKYLPNKSLAMLPERFRILCADELGLICRSVIIWSKPNGLPESVTDRVRRSHEDWMHFTREPRYFSAVDEIREPHAPASLDRYRSGFGQTKHSAELDKRYKADDLSANPLGKLPGSVWTVPTEPLRVPDHLGIDHFAAFPTEWPKRIIRGWSPAGACVECGEGRRPVVAKGGLDAEFVARRGGHADTTYSKQNHTANERSRASSTIGLNVSGQERRRYLTPDAITGHGCACGVVTGDTWTPKLDATGSGSGSPHVGDATGGLSSGTSDQPPSLTAPPTKPAIVLDPFGGTGTTAMVAKALGRHGISVDMSADYCRLAEWRTNDRDQLAKVLGIEKAGPVDDDQLDLFGESA